MDPVAKVPPRWIAGFALAVAATFVGWYGPLQILLARQAEALSPGGKENLLAGIGFGAYTSVDFALLTLYGASAVVGLAGAVLVYRIRSVR